MQNRATVIRGGHAGGALRAGVLALLASAVLAGCQSPPQGNPGGLSDPYRRTAADRYDPRADVTSMLEFSDEVGEALAQRISRIDEIAQRDQKVAVYLGDIENRTMTPTSDFEIMRRRIFTGLVNNDFVRRHVDVYEDPNALDRTLDRLAAGGAGRDVARYDADDIYVLQGYFGEQTRGRGTQSNFYFEISLVHLATGRLVFTETVDLKQVR